MKDNIAITLGTLVGIMSFLVASERLRSMLANSAVEFYLICTLFCILILLFIMMHNNKKDTKKEIKDSYEQTTTEYKEHVGIELKTIKFEINQIKQDVGKITPAIKEEFKDIKKLIAANNKNILDLYKDTK